MRERETNHNSSLTQFTNFTSHVVLEREKSQPLALLPTESINHLYQYIHAVYSSFPLVTWWS